MPRATVVGTSASTTTNRSNAVKHFNAFLQKRGVEAIKQFCRNESQPDANIFLEGDNLTYSNIDKTKVTYVLMDEFAHYLANEATHLNDPTIKISCNTGDNYFSQVKNKMTSDLADKGQSNAFLSDREQTGRLRQAMTKLFAARAAAENVPLSQPHTTASRSDIYCAVLMCIMSCKYELAAYAFFLVSLVQFCGRGTEVARIAFRNITMTSPPEFNDPDEKIANVSLWRQKTQTWQKLSVFGHKNQPLFDWYFLLGYVMILNKNGHVSEQLFPSFDQKAQQDLRDQAENKRSQSRVSDHFSFLFGKVEALYHAFVERLDARDEQARAHDHAEYRNLNLNPEISSHSPRRFSVEWADLNPFVKITWTCFRAGWLVRAVHTIFDYLSGNSEHSDRQTARNISEWTDTDPQGRIGGGRPPSLLAVTRNDRSLETPMKELKAHLFYRYTAIDGANSTDLQDCILATILKDLRYFINLLLVNPFGDFGRNAEEVWTKHEFLQSLETAATNAGIPEPRRTLLDWSDRIHHDWVCRNWEFLPFEEVAEYLNEQGEHPIDPRSVMTMLRSALHQLGAMKVVQEQQNRKIMELTNVIVALQQSNQNLQQSIQATVQGLTNTIMSLTALIVLALTTLIPFFGRVISGAGQPLPQEISQLLTRLRNAVPQPIDQLDAFAQLPIPPRVGGRGDGTGRAPSLPLPSAPAGRQEPPPEKLGKVLMETAFSNWFLQSWHKTLDQRKVDKAVRNAIRTAMEFFCLFLQDDVAPLPDDFPLAQCSANEPWRKELADIFERGWKCFEIFFKTQVRNRASRIPKGVSAFKRLMAHGNYPSEELPHGPPRGELHPSFQPRTKLRNRDAIMIARLEVDKKHAASAGTTGGATAVVNGET